MFTLGGVIAHILALSKSKAIINRSIAMSGNAFSYFAHYTKNSQVDLLCEVFQEEMGNQTGSEALYHFLKNAPIELIVQKTPVFNGLAALLSFIWGITVEGLKHGKFKRNCINFQNISFTARWKLSY